MHRCQLSLFIPKALVITFRLENVYELFLNHGQCNYSHTLPSSTQFSDGDFDKVNLTYPSIEKSSP